MMYIIKSFIILAFALFTSLAFATEIPQISQQQLLTALKSAEHNIVVLDVRSAQEYKNGHLVNAINVSHNTVADKLVQLSQYKGNTVVVYCRSGRRAAFAEKILAENDFKNLRHLTGDMNGWLAAELPVIVGENAQ